jgi:hypothetical protein
MSNLFAKDASIPSELLAAAATEPLLTEFVDQLRKDHDETCGALRLRMRRMLVKAYAEGVQDGFVQGCKSEARK